MNEAKRRLALVLAALPLLLLGCNHAKKADVDALQKDKKRQDLDDHSRACSSNDD